MEAVIVNFRGSRRRKNFSQLILKVGKKPEELVGKEVIWKTASGKEIKGKVTAKHGNKDCVRAKFERGLPGQSLGSKVEIK